MIRIVGCIVDAHDIRLVVLAGAICVFGCYTTLTVLERARIGGGARIHWRWLSAAAIVAGASVWATHFAAMLAFRPGMLVGYHVLLTGLSIAIAIVASWVALVIAHRGASPRLGGALFGAAIGAMHYTGMAALSAPAQVHWDAIYVAASLLVGAAFGAAALGVFARGINLRTRLMATALMTLAIFGHHFTGMAALTLTPSPLTRVSAGAVLAPEWLAIVVTVMIMIVLFGLAASALDHHW